MASHARARRVVRWWWSVVEQKYRYRVSRNQPPYLFLVRTSHVAVMMGKPVVAGTRITVESILEKLASGESPEQILEAHPRLKQEHIRAALEFAAQASVMPTKIKPCSLPQTKTLESW